MWSHRSHITLILAWLGTFSLQLMGGETGTAVFPNHVVINEVLSSNTRCNYDQDFGAFSDWIELYNPTGSEVILEGWYLTDNPDNRDKWRLPPGTVIPAEGYLLFWADGKALVPGQTTTVEFTEVEEITVQEYHLNFRIGREKEEVLLFDPGLVMVDSITLVNQERDYSSGRDPVNPDAWCFLGEPTPLATNSSYTSAAFDLSASPLFSDSGGLYPGALTVDLGPAIPGGVIRYTTDGSEPTSSSAQYTTPLQVNFSQVVKARLYEEGKLPGAVVTQTYIIDEVTDLPILSISTDHWNLWDFKFGLYQKSLKNREVFAHLEYFDREGDREFRINAGLQLFGSQVFLLDQKPFSIFFRNRYGQEVLDYGLFRSREHTRYKSLVLRNGGNDNGLTMFRDGLGAVLVENRVDLDHQSYQPVVVYMNGRYWGIFNLREKLNDDYLESTRGANPGYVDILEDSLQVNNGDANHYEELIRFVSQNDLSQHENYEVVTRKIDVDEFINYMSYKIYGGYIQWQVNNKYWRERTRGSAWRWIAFDLEHCFAGPGSDTYDGNTLLAAMEPDDGPTEWHTLLFRKLMENETFRERFIQRSALLMNTIFREERVTGIIDSLKQQIAGEMEAHITRWGSPVSMTAWNQNIGILKEFMENRSDYMYSYMMEYFQIADTSRLTIGCSEGGKIGVCSSYILAGDSATFTLFNQVPVNLVAMPEPGFVFRGWNGSDPDLQLELVLHGETVVYALFERSDQHLVPDTISGRLILDDPAQPWVATGNIVIPYGDSLIMEEGVVLYMRPGSSIVNDGFLQINGTRANPVTIDVNPSITGTYCTSSPRRWGGIVVRSPEPTKISHALIRNASSGMQIGGYKGAISAVNSNLILKGVTIGGVRDPVYGYRSHVRIDSCSLSSRGTGDLINLRGCGGAVIRDNDLKGNFYEDTDAIDLDSVSGAVVEGNLIYGFFGFNSDGIDLGEGAEDIVIRNNRIFSCSDKGISVGQGSEVEALGNLIVDCNQGFGIKDFNSYARIDQNTLYNNQTGVACFEKNPGNGGGAAAVENTIISNSVEQSVFLDKHSSLTISYSLSDRDTLLGYNNLLDRPLFAGASDHNFYLEEGSPCIDGGTPNRQDPDGSRADMGAFIAENAGDKNPVMISEVNFNGHWTFDAGDWIELYNGGNEVADLTGWVLKGENAADEYLFPDGLLLQPGGYLVVARQKDSVRMLYGDGLTLAGDLAFGLNRDGEVVKLYNGEYQLVHSFQYSPEHPWPDGPDGKGATLELFAGETDNSDPGSWHASYILGGTPGSGNSETSPVTGLYINEFMARNDAAYADGYGEYDDWIEVYNGNEFPVELGGINFVDGDQESRLWMIPLYDTEATTIGAGAHKLFWADKDPEQGILHLDFNVPASGGSVGLAQVIQREIHVIDRIDFVQQAADRAFGRYPDGGSLLTDLQLTPGSSNIMLSVADPDADESGLLVYPNPVTDGLLGVVLTENYGGFNYLITDLTGRMVLKGRAERNPVAISVTLTPGSYLLVVNGPERQYKKVIIVL
ncbi:MAG: CotH kinase family protein [Bacteroidota bacterium]